jgi:hypothetical protein
MGSSGTAYIFVQNTYSRAPFARHFFLLPSLKHCGRSWPQIYASLERLTDMTFPTWTRRDIPKRGASHSLASRDRLCPARKSFELPDSTGTNSTSYHLKEGEHGYNGTNQLSALSPPNASPTISSQCLHRPSLPTFKLTPPISIKELLHQPTAPWKTL